MIIGYSAAHNQLFTPIYGQTLNLIPRLKELGLIDDESKVIIGQKCLVAEYQRAGIMGKMDKVLYNHLSAEFKYYLASVSAVNASSLDFVTRSGYRKVYESGGRMYFILDIHRYPLNEESYQAITSGGQKIDIRFAAIDDIPDLIKLNTDWLKENRRDLSHGYLATTFTEANWAFMIARKWVTLAEIRD